MDFCKRDFFINVSFFLNSQRKLPKKERVHVRPLESYEVLGILRGDFLRGAGEFPRSAEPATPRPNPITPYLPQGPTLKPSEPNKPSPVPFRQ